MLKNKIFILLGVVFLFSFTTVSALGLYLNISSFNITKDVSTNIPLTLQLINSQSYSFYNISIENNPYINFTLISQLDSGQIANINANVNSNVDISTILRIKGFYQAQIGVLNNTYVVNITNYQSNPCDMVIVKGDTVTFRNMLNNQIQMKKIEDSSVITILDPGQNFTYTFSIATNFNYYFSISGFNFPQQCHISVLNDNGLVNDPRLDALLNLTVKTNYPPTTISFNIITTNYTTDPFVPQDGVMTVTNTGSNLAKNIHLNGEWFSFNTNDFDLGVGQSKGVVYTILPLITQTSDTNKTYTKILLATGNFVTLNQNFNIFVKYNQFDANASGQDANYLINVFCPKFPNSILCNPEPKVIYKYVANGSDQTFNVSMSTEQLRDVWLFMFGLGDKIDSSLNIYKSNSDSLNTRIGSIETQQNNLTSQFSSDSATRNSTSNGIMTFFIVFGALVVASFLVGLIYIYKMKRETKKMEGVW
jgi:plastocyanin